MKGKLRLSIFFAAMILFQRGGLAAGEITIGSKSYPSIILIPIISIIICSAILIVLLVNIARRKIDTSGLRGIGRSLFTKKQKKVTRQENIYLRDIKKFRKELAGKSVDEAFNLLSGITNRFFKEILNLNYEFTYDELEKELLKRNKKKELVEICRQMSEMRYSGKKVTRQELDDFSLRIEQIVRKEDLKKEETELKVSRALEKGKPDFFSRIMQMQTEKSKKKHLIELMGQEEEALKKDMEIAKKIYHNILSSYYKLPSKDRKEIYEKLTNFYKQVNSMLFSSFYGQQSRKQVESFKRELEELHKKAEKVIAKEKTGMIKVPEIKKPHAESVKERAASREELKKLEKIEKEARERIKSISESVVEQHLVHQEIKPEPKTTIREIKYTVPQEHIRIHEPIRRESENAPIIRKAPEIKVHAEKEKIVAEKKEVRHEIKQEHKPLAEHKIIEKKQVQETDAKSRKFMHIAKEEQEIRDKLARLS
ncbi:MAG: hypothetical protein V1886_01700 [archaeon]